MARKMANNKWLIALGAAYALGLSMPTFAHYAYYTHYGCSGVYLGGQFGYGHVHYNRDAFFGVGAHDSDIAGRVYFGNQFNQYVGLELGAALYSNVELDSDFGHIRTRQLDLLLKLGAPFGYTCFRGDVKLGGVVTFTDIKPTDAGKAFGFENDSVTEVRPVAGAGASYNFTQNIAMDVSYLHVFGNPTSESHPAPNIDFITLGLSYLFTV